MGAAQPEAEGVAAAHGAAHVVLGARHPVAEVGGARPARVDVGEDGHEGAHVMLLRGRRRARVRGGDRVQQRPRRPAQLLHVRGAVWRRRIGAGGGRRGGGGGGTVEVAERVAGATSCVLPNTAALVLEDLRMSARRGVYGLPSGPRINPLGRLFFFGGVGVTAAVVVVAVVSSGWRGGTSGIAVVWVWVVTVVVLDVVLTMCVLLDCHVTPAPALTEVIGTLWPRQG